MTTITSFLNDRGFYDFEGHSGDNLLQREDLLRVLDAVLEQKERVRVLEIGFNAGHSADLFLSHHPNITVTSFDLGTHPYIGTAKEYIDITYPGRHTLLLGDSRLSVPTYARSHPTDTFDVIFIDGCHDYEVAKADMENCRGLAHADTVVILDDTIFTAEWVEGWTVGPTRSWTEHLQEGSVVEQERKDYQHGRGMSWGKYVL